MNNFIAELTTHNNTALAGWCVNLVSPDEDVVVSLYWGDTFLRSVTARKSSVHPQIISGRIVPEFWVRLAPEFVSLLPPQTELRILMPNGQEIGPNLVGNFEAIGCASDEGTELRSLLDQGYSLDKWGSLKLPFSHMSDDRKSAYLSSFKSATTYFRERYSLTLFPHYGTLLGYARGKCFIPHDDDLDASYIVFADDISQVGDHFFDLVEKIQSDGHFCHPVSAGQMHLGISGETEIIDVFTSWIQTNGVFNSFFATSGLIRQPLTFFEDQMEGLTMNIPLNYEEILSLTYGIDWRTPDASFQFHVPKGTEELMRSLQLYGEERCEELRSQ